MKTFKVDRKSWHYHIIKTYGTTPWELEQIDNLCLYIQRLCVGFMLLALISMVGGAAAWMVLDFTIWTLVSIQVGELLPMGPAALAFTISIIACTVIFGVAAICIWYGRRPSKPHGHYDDTGKWVPPQPSLVEAWYRSFKEKTCIRIEQHD